MNKGKIIPAIFVVFGILLSSFSVQASAYQLGTVMDSTAAYLMKQVPSPTTAQTGGEWLVLGLSRSGVHVPESYNDTYLQNLRSKLQEKGGILHEKKYTEYARAVLALTSLGQNPSDVAGYDLLLPLADYEKVVWQGRNGAVFALLALDSGNYDIPKNDSATVQATRQMYIDFLLQAQNSDGGIGLTTNTESDTDVTAMMVQALSRYTKQENVKNAVDKALMFLSEHQNEDGTYTSMNGNNVEACAQVLTALSLMNIPETDHRFIKNGNTVVDGLMSFYLGDGKGFSHMKDDRSANLMATEQVLCALSAHWRNKENQTSFYDMSDVAKKETVEERYGLPGKHEAVGLMPIRIPGKTFWDIPDNPYREEIEALAERTIINGKSETLFSPDETMTRAEFSTITIKALNLPQGEEAYFKDVEPSMWHFGYVSTAAWFGVVKGVSETEFYPDNTITREQAAVMMTRVAKLCGNQTAIGENDAQMILTQFDDYTNVSDWAKDAVAWCVEKGIIRDDTMEIQPKEYVTRGEVAFMVHGVLSISNLMME